MRQGREIYEIEIEYFIGLIIYMGFLKKPTVYFILKNVKFHELQEKIDYFQKKVFTIF